jgi:CheY-like chemotaxis protein
MARGQDGGKNVEIRAPRARPILVVEDNPMDLDFMLQAFEEHGVVNPVLVCRDGEEALQFIADHAQPDDAHLPLLVLLDLRLPKVDGIEVLRQARQHPFWRQIPFAFAEVVKQIKFYWLLTNEPPFPGTDGRTP